MPEKFEAIKRDPVATLFANGIASLTQALQSQFNEIAQDLQWPDEVIRSVHVTYDYNNDALSVKKDLPEKVYEALQYGSPSTPPKPAIDNFLHSHAVQREFENRLEKVLDGLSSALEEKLAVFLDEALSQTLFQDVVSPLAALLNQEG